MAGYGFKILNNSVRALAAQQAVIATTGNNIANVNTPGYTRRIVNLETSDGRSSSTVGVDVGNGVSVSSIQRVAEGYINQILREAGGKASFSEVQNSFMGRINELFGLTGDNPTLSENINEFYAALNDLTTNPASIELRKNAIERGEDLVSFIGNTYNALAAMQDEANNRLDSEVSAINTLTRLIAETNANVVQASRAGGESPDDLDRRDELVRQLGEKISFQVVDQPDGGINIYLSNGFSLVNGTSSADLETTITPSFATGAQPPSLSGGTLKYIVYDYSNGAGTGHIDLTQIIKDGEGSTAALLNIRGYNNPNNTSAFDADGPLVEVASRIESITRDLLTRFNATYRGVDEDSVTAGFQPNAMDLNGNTPAVFGFFDFTFSGLKDADSDGIAEQADLDALTVDNFSSILQIAISDPRAFAAARDSDPTDGALTLVAGNGENVEALANLQDTSATFVGGTYSLVGTYDDVYKETIAHVSSLKISSQTRFELDQDNLATAQSKRDEVSAVSLDEEFSNLIKYQKAYQASAKMIKVASDLMDIVGNLL